MTPLILASASATRLALLRNAGLAVTAVPARIDEEAVTAAMTAEGAPPRDVADMLAEMKARKVSERHPDGVVLGCDQVLDLGGAVLGKPASPDQARADLDRMRGRGHALHSAVVLCEGGRPQWRHVGTARLSMRAFSDDFRDGYIARNWDAMRHSAGGYLVEGEGIRLFDAIDGDWFTVLGLPLLPLLRYLETRGLLSA